MNFGELKTSITDSLGTNNFSTAQIDKFVVLAEQKIGARLRTAENQIVVDGTSDASGQITFGRIGEIAQITSGSGDTLIVLRQIPISAKNEYGTSGRALAWYHFGTFPVGFQDTMSNKVQLVPAEQNSGFSVTMFETPETLEGEANGETRRLLDRWPTLYLDGALAEGFASLRDWENAALHERRFDETIERANAAYQQRYNPISSSPYKYYGGQPRGL